MRTSPVYVTDEDDVDGKGKDVCFDRGGTTSSLWQGAIISMVRYLYAKPLGIAIAADNLRDMHWEGSIRYRGRGGPE